MDTNEESLLAQANYRKFKTLKKLYKSYYNLEKEALKGNQTALCIFLDLRAALEPSKRIVTIKQRFAIVYVLINEYTLEEASTILQCSPSTISKHIQGGLKRISKALENGSLYHNKYEYIMKYYNTTPIEEIAKKFNITESAVKNIYYRLKKEGGRNGME